jgi:hypothetical protein
MLTIGGLPEILDKNNKIGLYLPYLQYNDIDNYDISILFQLFLRHREDDTFNDFCGIYSSIPKDKNKVIKYCIEALDEIKKKYNIEIYTTLKNIEYSYELLYHYGADIDNTRDNSKIHMKVRELFDINDSNCQKKLNNIYISRSREFVRNINNENILIPLLKNINFNIIFMEDYTFREQIDIFANSKLIIAPHGAALTYSIFCNKNAHVIEIIPPNNNPNLDCFVNIYNGVNIKYTKYTDMIEYDHSYNMNINIDNLIKLIYQNL